MTVLKQLAEIPDLAVRVWLTRHTGPTRTSETGRGGTSSDANLPPEVAAMDLLRTDEHGPFQHLVSCIDVIVTEVGDTAPDWPAATWDETCAWLIRWAHLWQTDPWLFDWVIDGVQRVHAALRQWTGDRAPARLSCLKCHGRMVAIHAGVQCSDCGHIWSAADIAHEVMLDTPMSLPEIAAQLGVSERAAQRWTLRRGIQPTTTHKASPRNPARYLPRDFVSLPLAVKLDLVA